MDLAEKMGVYYDGWGTYFEDRDAEYDDEDGENEDDESESDKSSRLHFNWRYMLSQCTSL